ncbi:MAG: NAD(P)-dependent oxidoreductase [Geminicoccaceae bacterium]
MQRVLITGAAGAIGRRLRVDIGGIYPIVRFSDRADMAPPGAGEEVMEADLADMAACEAICAGVDGIVHLGGQAIEADWDTVLQANIVGCYNLFEAARRQGVKRIVFATTNHVIGFYRRAQRIDHTVPVRPDSRYGASKAFGEALGRLYADKHGLRVLNIRIGNFGDRPLDRRRLSIWLSPRDFLQLVRIGLDHPDLHYETVYGASENDRTWWDNSNAYRLGYRPQDEAEPFAPEVLASETEPNDLVAELFQGGPFCSAEFDGDPERID